MDPILAKIGKKWTKIGGKWTKIEGKCTKMTEIAGITVARHTCESRLAPQEYSIRNI